MVSKSLHRARCVVLRPEVHEHATNVVFRYSRLESWLSLRAECLIFRYALMSYRATVLHSSWRAEDSQVSGSSWAANRARQGHAASSAAV